VKRHHLPQANIIQKDLFCQVDKGGLFVGGLEGIRLHFRLWRKLWFRRVQPQRATLIRVAF